jgi:hypothetical protein
MLWLIAEKNDGIKVAHFPCLDVQPQERMFGAMKRRMNLGYNAGPSKNYK